MNMFKNFMLRKLAEKQLKNIPSEQRDMILRIIEEHPELMQTIALEVEQHMQGGMDQTRAMMAVMKKHENELRGIMS